jgi:hypothetical protein
MEGWGKTERCKNKAKKKESTGEGIKKKKVVNKYVNKEMLIPQTGY